MKHVIKLLLPVLSIISLYKHKLSVFLNKRKSGHYIVHYIIEHFDNTSVLSLESFITSHLSNFDIKIFVYCYDNYKSLIADKISNKNFLLLSFTDSENLFEMAVYNALKQKKVYVQGFVHAELYFHEDWLEKLIELENGVFMLLNKKKIGAFSTYNPNDFKHFNEFYFNKEIEIKDGFSFLSVFFYNSFLNRHKKNIQKYPKGKNIMQLFKTYEYFSAFTKESYLDSFSRISRIKADNFFEKPNNLAFAKKPINDNQWLLTKSATYIPYLKSNVLVIQVKYGGLGDHLFCSHLPRIAKETGRYQKVYISNLSEFRQEATKHFIWELNPYIDGFCDEPGYYIERFFGDFNDMNILDKFMLLHNLDDNKRYHEPEIYYTPKIKRELTTKIIFDPNYIADSGDKMNSSIIDEFFLRNNIRIDFQMTPKFKNVTTNSFSDWLSADSLEDFINIIASCQNIYCFATGTATLACAIGKKAHVFYNDGFNRQFLHSKNNEYIKLKK